MKTEKEIIEKLKRLKAADKRLDKTSCFQELNRATIKALEWVLK